MYILRMKNKAYNTDHQRSHTHGKDYHHVSEEKNKRYHHTAITQDFIYKNQDKVGGILGEKLKKELPEYFAQIDENNARQAIESEKKYPPRFQYIQHLFQKYENRNDVYRALMWLVRKENELPENKKSWDEFYWWIKKLQTKNTGLLSANKFNKDKSHEQLEREWFFYAQNTIQKITPRLFKEVVTYWTHKHWNINKKGDIDGETSIALLKYTGLIENNKQVDYVKHGEKKEGSINIDTGRANWITFEPKNPNSLFWWTLIIDQHPQWPASSSYLVYKILKTLWTIPKNEQIWLERYIDFVNIVDFLGYEVVAADIQNKWKTLVGLHRIMVSEYETQGIHAMMNYFKEDPRRTGLEILTDEQLLSMNAHNPFKKIITSVSINLSKISTKIDAWVKKEEEKFETLKNNHKLKTVVVYNWIKFIVDNQWVFEKNGKVETALSNGVETALSKGYGLYQIKPSGDIYIYSPKGFGKELAGVWEHIRGKILILKKPEVYSKKSNQIYLEQIKKIEELFNKNLSTRTLVHNLVDAIMIEEDNKIIKKQSINTKI